MDSNIKSADCLTDILINLPGILFGLMVVTVRVVMSSGMGCMGTSTLLFSFESVSTGWGGGGSTVDVDVDVLGVVTAFGGGEGEGFGGGGGGLVDGLTVLHIGGWEVISHGGLGLFVVVVVAAIKRQLM